MPDISASIGSEENQLLQNEVATLTHDMHAISERLQTSQEGEIMCVCVCVGICSGLIVTGVRNPMKMSDISFLKTAELTSKFKY